LFDIQGPATKEDQYCQLSNRLCEKEKKKF